MAPGGGTGPTVSVLAFVGRVPPRGAGSASNRQLRDAPLSPQLDCHVGDRETVADQRPIYIDGHESLMSE